MRKILMALLLAGLVSATFASRLLFAKPIAFDDDFFVDSNHLPLEEDFESKEDR